MMRSDRHTKLAGIWMDELHKTITRRLPSADETSKILEMVAQVKYMHCFLDKKT